MIKKITHSLQTKKMELPGIKIAKIYPEAVIPTKAHPSDSGFDLTITKIEKVIGPNLTLYNTGIRLAPDSGYYVDLVARSSLMKSGYMLANNIGIIDNHYRGPIMVALLKFDLTKPDLELPMRVAQMIPRKIVECELIVVADDQLDATSRGAGGFGSTGK